MAEGQAWTLKPGFPRWSGVLPTPCTDFSCEISIFR